MTLFLKKISKIHQFLKSRVSVSGFLMKSRSRSFNQVLISKVMVSTASLIIMFCILELMLLNAVIVA